MKITSARKHGFYAILATDEAGYSWILNHRFGKDDPKTTATLRKIRAAGEINPQHWHRYDRKREW